MRLIFVRHGEPDYKNDCLTENGISQAKSAAERLKNENISVIYSSPMGRAKETASYTADTLGLEINVLDFMHEIDWGTAENTPDAEAPKFGGHPWTLGYELLTEHPEMISSECWREHFSFGNNICMGYYDMISDKFDKFLENFGLYRKDGLYLCREECETTAALFAHGGSGAVMFSHVLNLPFPFVLTSMPYGVCSVSVLNFEQSVGKKVIPRLELFNDMRHISTVRAEKLHFDK